MEEYLINFRRLPPFKENENPKAWQKQFESILDNIGIEYNIQDKGIVIGPNKVNSLTIYFDKHSLKLFQKSFYDSLKGAISFAYRKNKEMRIERIRKDYYLTIGDEAIALTGATLDSSKLFLNNLD